ncbi:MAG: Xaa-Pro peptidase family protein [Anaerolineales bacterium]|nr:Xaa-Pro peptidase family protein [Anaerolineales bacterium]MDW8227553.1 Xaa-Pro peptidase family protein [Anaerolineales bacterium]
MKSDLDILMQQYALDAILVLGSATHNPPMYYLTGGGHISNAFLIKKPGETGVIFCNDMEREEAARSGLEVIPLGKYPWQEMLQQAGGDSARMAAMRLKQMFADCGLTRGKVGLYGHTDVSSTLAMLTHFRQLAPEIEIIGEPRDRSLVMLAMETKDEDEVARIRQMGRITTEVVRRVADDLTTRPIRDDQVLVKEDGTPLTVADVKSRIKLWLAELGADNPEGCIFAIGRDAGIPHSAGTPTDWIRLGQTIVFDIYPCEAGGGYYYDFTRTWSLGYASPQAQALYDQVKSVYERVIASLRVNTPFKEYQRLVCEEFEKMGHPTLLTVSAPLEGYVHSVGHGLGLNVHERPWSGLTAEEENRLRPGVVFTIEPGLYYPDQGLGVRIEDTYWVRPDGVIEKLADYPYDFVLQMKQS